MDVPVDKRVRILKAAIDLIVQNGLQFPMATIAVKADVAMGSVYKYFASKDDLIHAVYADLAAQINGALVHAIDPHEPARERITRYIYEYIDYFWADGDRAALFEYLSNVPLIAPSELDRLFAPINAYNSQIVALAQAEGLLKSAPPSTLAGFIGGGIRNTLKWHRLRNAELAGPMRDLIARACWDAISV